MPRNISFSMTTSQFLDGTKDVTRRMGWLGLSAGDRLMACKKCMGLKPGEKIDRLGLIEVVSVRREPLNAISARDVIREGFPDWSVGQFVEFFIAGHNGCTRDSLVTRIEFRKVQIDEFFGVRASPFPTSKSIIISNPS